MRQWWYLRKNNQTYRDLFELSIISYSMLNDSRKKGKESFHSNILSTMYRMLSIPFNFSKCTKFNKNIFEKKLLIFFLICDFVHEIMDRDCKSGCFNIFFFVKLKSQKRTRFFHFFTEAKPSKRQKQTVTQNQT